MRTIVLFGCMVASLLVPDRFFPQINRALEWATRSGASAP